MSGAFLTLWVNKAPGSGMCRRAACRRVVALLAVAAACAVPSVATAALPPPAGLWVEGGEETWHVRNEFSLRWHLPPADVATSIETVNYRVRDPFGAVAMDERTLDWPTLEIKSLSLPPQPGAYTAEVWYEELLGRAGAPALVQLRFDDRRPGAVRLLVDDGWIGRAAFPYTVRIGRPEGQAPVSGIRGYAVSIGSAPGDGPCAAADSCTAAETDLSGGAANDSFSIPELPEGVSYVEAVAVAGSGMCSPAVGRAMLRVDETAPAMRLHGVPAGWVDHPVELTATAADAGSGMAPGGEGPTPFTALRIDGGTPIVAVGDSVSAQVFGEGAHTVASYARDLAGNLDDGATSNGVRNPDPATATVRIDRTAPSLAFDNAQEPFDPESIRATASDAASGLDPASGWIGVRRAGSGDAFAALPPAPAPRGELRARWDSDAYPTGEYEFRATVRDVAGNRTTTTRRADGSAMALANPLKLTTALAVSFAGGALSRRAPYGGGASIEGQLSTGRGGPPGGMPVRIVERFEGGGVREFTVATDADGGFGARLAPGPSREALAFFDGSPVLSRASSHALQLAVRSRVMLRASAGTARIGGPPLVFSGRVAAPAGMVPPEGKSVELQFRLPSLPWRQFRTIRTDARGRFRYAYRFSDDDSRGVRFQFRAYAPAQDAWPYEPGSSRPIVVRGR